MKRRILLVDDEVAVLLTLKAVLEISGYDVETAASAREGKHRLRSQEFDMVITDMRMESEASGAEVVQAAREASYHPAVALLTAFPLAEEDWQDMGADKMLVKPMQTRALLQQIERLMATRVPKDGDARALAPNARPKSRANANVALAASSAKTAGKKKNANGMKEVALRSARSARGTTAAKRA